MKLSRVNDKMNSNITKNLASKAIAKKEEAFLTG